MLENNLIKANEDIVTISTIAKRMGWGAVSEQSFQRILYLVQILYSFKYAGENIFSYYHFTVTTFGPYSDLIERSLVFLKSSFNLREEEGGLVLSSKKEIPLNQQKVEWLKNNNLWNEVRDTYLEKKNLYLRKNDHNHPSFICYIEAVNEVYYKTFH